jgi:two-component system, cell cycle response regulator
MNRIKRVLIVDDDNLLCSVFKEGLMAAGYECETAPNGKTALERIELGHFGNQPFDLMVTDIVMPGMDGFELSEKAKKIDPELAVIVMTGFQQEESYDRAIAAGASDFIKKPFSIPELAARITRVLRDTKIVSEIRQKQEEVRDISREMIAGMEDAASKRIARLEEEILNLRKLRPV